MQVSPSNFTPYGIQLINTRLGEGARRQGRRPEAQLAPVLLCCGWNINGGAGLQGGTRPADKPRRSSPAACIANRLSYRSSHGVQSRPMPLLLQHRNNKCKTSDNEPTVVPIADCAADINGKKWRRLQIRHSTPAVLAPSCRTRSHAKIRCRLRRGLASFAKRLRDMSRRGIQKCHALLTITWRTSAIGVPGRRLGTEFHPPSPVDVAGCMPWCK